MIGQNTGGSTKHLLTKIRSFAEQDKQLVLPSTDSIIDAIDARLNDDQGRVFKMVSARPHSTLATGNKQQRNKIEGEWKQSNVNFSFNVGANGKDSMTFRNVNESGSSSK